MSEPSESSSDFRAESESTEKESANDSQAAEALVRDRLQKLKALREAAMEKSSQDMKTAKQSGSLPPEAWTTAQTELAANEQAMADVIAEAESKTKRLLEEADAREAEPRPEVMAVVVDRIRDIAADFHDMTDNLRTDPEIISDFFLERLKKLAELPTSDLNDDDRQQVYHELGQSLAAVTGELEPAAALRLARQVMAETNRPQIVLSAIEGMQMPADERRGILLAAAKSHDGLDIVTQYGEQYAKLDRGDVLAALAECYPAAAMTGVISENRHHRLQVAERALANLPNLALRLDDFGFSPVDKYVVAVRLARSDPEAFVQAFNTSRIDFTKAERLALSQEFAEVAPDVFGQAVRALELSHDDIVNLIEQLPAAERDDMLVAAGVPLRWLDDKFRDRKQGGAQSDIDRAKPLTDEAAGQVENSLMSAETERKLNEARAVERQLLLAIERAYPERVERERLRSREEEQLLAPFKRVGEIGIASVNAPLIVSCVGRDLPACYKPVSREKGYPPVDDDTSREHDEWLRDGIPPGQSAVREWLAYQIDKVFALDIVPPTVLRGGPFGVGSTQSWLIGDMADDVRGWQESADKDSLQKMAFFDAVVHNTDRHSGNFMVLPDRKLMAIDNGMILSERPDLDEIISRPLEELGGQPISDSIIERIEAFQGQPEIQTALRDTFAVAFGEKSDDQWQRFLERLEKLNSPDRERGSGAAGTFPVRQFYES